ncbi:RHS repeat-associated core domain-containing protein [Methylocystis parvus]|nr:RHS repeat-associated core domain-containing protein [Methylocystis parvus]WBK02036.1 RHS repeat-associated core domain-containing protein [Methylocystis parvus OBBP]
MESGLAYNWHRHYDATLGRYVQPDPIGYAGGRSLYGYVGQNPLAYVDPDGRTAIAIPAICIRFPALCIGAAGAAARAAGDLIQAGIDFCRSKTGNDSPKDGGCDKEWKEAYEICRELIANGENFNKRRFGPEPYNLRRCAMGYVSERCGGNPVTH